MDRGAWPATVHGVTGVGHDSDCGEAAGICYIVFCVFEMSYN